MADYELVGEYWPMNYWMADYWPEYGAVTVQTEAVTIITSDAATVVTSRTASTTITTSDASTSVKV